MIVLCAITGLIKLVLLIALTGVLASIAAVSRLMEVTISLIHPLTIFFLRQSGKLVILSVKVSARRTSLAFSRMCTMDCYGGTLRIPMDQPDIVFDMSMEPNLIEGATSEGIIESQVDVVQPSGSQTAEQDGGGVSKAESATISFQPTNDSDATLKANSTAYDGQSVKD